LATPDFRFKRFTIRHDRSAMKVGTDGVLLGAWAGNLTPLTPHLSPHTSHLTPLTSHLSPHTSHLTPHTSHLTPHTSHLSPHTSHLSPLTSHLTPQRCLDIGTGTGLIALMLAQRFPTAKIEGIDIDTASINQAKENVENSVFKDQITLKEQDFSDIDSFSNQYDLIVSNPPFYTEDTLGGNQARDRARHATSLPFETLVSNVAKLLVNDGLFSVIIPYQSAADFISICVVNRLYLTRRVNIRSTARKPFNRVLLEFSTSIQPSETSTLTLYDSNNNRSPEYTQLTNDFYL